jgi:putative transposase
VSAFIDERRADFGVEPICSVLGVSASAYYQRATGDRSARAIEDERLVAEIRQVHEANYEAYGYRRTWLQLQREGERVPRCQVQRLMRAEGIRGAKRRGHQARTTTSDANAAERPDLLERDFTAIRPNQRWVADFTYLRCWEGLGFFSFILDVHSRYLCGWQFASNMRADLVEDALQMAVAARGVDPLLDLVHHSDRGSQYTSEQFSLALAEHDILASMGSVGDAYDNAMAESLVDTFKTELIADRVWRTRGQLEVAIARWVGWYNNQRLHSALGDLPPVEFEQVWELEQVLQLEGSADRC